MECVQRHNRAMAETSQGPGAPVKGLGFHSGLLGGR